MLNTLAFDFFYDAAHANHLVYKKYPYFVIMNVLKITLGYYL